MIIKILNYQLISDPYGTYDLIEEKKATKKNNTSYIRKEILSHGLTLERAIKRIIAQNLHNNPITLSLYQFLIEFKNEREKVEKLIDLEYLKQ